MLVESLLVQPQERGGLVLVAGEPGIGKSRLAEELAAEARRRDVEVHWGRCWEAGGAPPYWPWVNVVRSQLRSRSTEWVRDVLGQQGALLVPLLPELGDVFAGVPTSTTSEPDLERFRLFEAVAGVLRGAAVDRAQVLILDDLHAADAPSLLLLRFLAGELAHTSIGILALYRSTDLTPVHQLTSVEAALLRVPAAQRIVLSGLQQREVAQLMEMTAGRHVPPAIVAAVHERTDGNPLFVGEVARLMGGAPAPLAAVAVGRIGIPGGIREAIGGRLAGLPPPSRELLGVAAVLGREFSLDALARMTDRPALALLEDLEDVIGEGLLSAVAGQVGHLRFSHDLIRECLYEELGAARRLHLHLRAGDVLEEMYGPDDEHLAELAHHFFCAAPEVDTERATGYARRAGEAAIRALAYEEAGRLFRMALQLADGRGSVDDRPRCELLLALGDADARAGDMATARGSFRAAADLARKADLPHALARAALGYGGRFAWMRAGQDRTLVALLEDALETLSDDDSVPRVQVLSRLAGALRDEADPSRRDRLSQEAVSMARRLGDRPALAYALDGRFGAIWSPDRVEERLSVATDLTETARSIGDKEEEIAGRLAAILTLWELGDLDAVRVHLSEVELLVREIRQPAQRWAATLLRAALALLEGRFADAEVLSEEAYARGRSSLEVDSEAARTLQRWVIERERERADSVEPAIRRAHAEFTGYFHFSSVIAQMEAERGRRDEARQIVRKLVAGELEAHRADNYWLLALTCLAEVVFVVGGEEAAAEVLYGLLAPYADHYTFGPPEVSLGVNHRPLGLLATVIGRWDVAIDHFERALAEHEAAGARPWLAWSRFQYAVALLRRGEGGDRERAAELLDGAREIARPLGMSLLDRRVGELLGQQAGDAGSLAGPPAQPSPSPSTTTNVFRREGDSWTIVFGADSFRLRDTKGLRYLAALLAAPGRDIPAVDLVVGGGPARRVRPADELSRGRAASRQPVIDHQARVAYEERLRELDADLREAEGWSDVERESTIRAEMEFLTGELVRATGLGGRSRGMSSDAERARQSVRKAISAALARIGQHSRSLQQHLEVTVNTGHLCRYAPDPRLPPDWLV